MPKRKSRSRYIPKHVQEAVRERDGGICQKCGATDYIEFDHITPFSKGAPSTVENIQQLCRRCNSKKRDKTDNDCRKCGGWNPAQAKYCHTCGLEMPKKHSVKSYEESVWKRKAKQILLVIILAYITYLLIKPK